MNFELNALRKGRENMISIVDSYHADQLNHIPEGFNNNLAWNLGHVVVTHQLICYQLAGIEVKLSGDLIDNYRKGSKPKDFISEDEIGLFKEKAFSLIDDHEQDIKNGLFNSFKEYQTSYGVVLNSVNDSIIFNIMHENLHLGYMMAMRKLVN